MKPTALLVAAGLLFLIAGRTVAGGTAAAHVELEGLAPCYASPAPVWFSVTNPSKTQLQINVAVEMHIGAAWRETHPSLTGGYKFGRKVIRMLPFAPGQTLDLSVDPWLRPSEDEPAPELQRPDLLRILVTVITPASQRTVTSDIIRLAPRGGCK